MTMPTIPMSMGLGPWRSMAQACKDSPTMSRVGTNDVVSSRMVSHVYFFSHCASWA